jgi:hypothetical protein
MQTTPEQTTIPGTEAMTTNGHAEHSKRPNPGYIAFVSMQEDPELPKCFAQIQAKTKAELSKKLSDSKIVTILAVVKGREITFNTARKVTF